MRGSRRRRYRPDWAIFEGRDTEEMRGEEIITAITHHTDAMKKEECSSFF